MSMMMRMLLPLMALVLSPLLIHASKEKTWTLYHAWKGHDFTKRGKISLQLNEGVPELSIDNSQQIEDLPLDDFYQLKLVQDGSKDLYTLTSVPACQVHRASFRDEITLTFNQGASVVSMAYVPLVSPLASSCQEFQPSSEAKVFTSKISLETATPGMVLPAVLPTSTKPPPGLKLLKSKNNKNGGNPALEGQEEDVSAQSFLKKYWYIILPLFIMSMTGGGGAAEEAEQAPHPSQAQGGAAPAVAAAAPTQTAAPASGGAGGGARRRGKRG